MRSIACLTRLSSRHLIPSVSLHCEITQTACPVTCWKYCTPQIWLSQVCREMEYLTSCFHLQLMPWMHGLLDVDASTACEYWPSLQACRTELSVDSDVIVTYELSLCWFCASVQCCSCPTYTSCTWCRDSASVSCNNQLPRRVHSSPSCVYMPWM